MSAAQVAPCVDADASATAAASPRSVDRARFLSPEPPPTWPVLTEVASVADSAATVLIIQHSDRVPPAFVAFFLREQGVPFVVLAIDQPGAQLPPATQPWKAVVSLGGPQGSYEEEQHAWIAREKSFLLSHVQSRTPVLAICLGAQMLAHAIGGSAYAAPANQFEVGYPAVTLTEAGTKDAAIAKLFERLQRGPQAAPGPAAASAAASVAAAASASTPTTTGFLTHHGDTFDLPAGVECLAVSSAGFKQMFRAGSALAVQFHPEASVHEINTWTQWNPKRYDIVGSTAEDIVKHAKQQQAASFAHSEAFFEAWWTMAGFALKHSEQTQQQQQQQQAKQE